MVLDRVVALLLQFVDQLPQFLDLPDECPVMAMEGEGQFGVAAEWCVPGRLGNRPWPAQGP